MPMKLVHSLIFQPKHGTETMVVPPSSPFCLGIFDETIPWGIPWKSGASEVASPCGSLSRRCLVRFSTCEFQSLVLGWS